MIKAGDYIFSHCEGNKSFLVIRELSFSEYCDKHDDLMLEYDIDDAWSAWETSGPCFETLSLDGEISVIWKNNMILHDS